MSMNIYLRATATAKLYNGDVYLGEEKISKKFDCFQTPTKVTNTIINSNNPIEKYIEWVHDNFYKNERIELYEETLDMNFDIVKGKYLGYRIENTGRDHIKHLKRFLKRYSYWNIEWYAL